MGYSNSGRNGHTALKIVGELFANIGWEKKLCELNKDEVMAIAVVFQSIEGIEDVYSEQYLTEVYLRYGGARLGLDPETDIPF